MPTSRKPATRQPAARQPAARQPGARQPAARQADSPTPAGRQSRRQVAPRPGSTAGSSNSVAFADAARALGQCARRRGLVVPAFRSPPRLPEVSRTLRRRADGSVAVAVQVRNRPFGAVLADMVEGIVVANRLGGATATRTRTALWEAVTRADQLPPGTDRHAA